ncbi:tetratricopeptide repeat protein [Pseudoruegeria sp. HB172150]|uniref:tetratricopeptide repeat protein n=1 Tax=Pseudoruegeria sp. HB172150 TaxID=2721164 RepID=UPI0015578E06|nr:tetratricopeptide repeat protein [Pseudoruegeria sp. HB172150]
MFNQSIRAALLASAIASPVFAHEENRRTELFSPGVSYAEDGAPNGGAPVMVPGLGVFGMIIETGNPDAQAWFDQGLGQLWGFNHAEAVRAFRMAQQADPDCAMCYWGESYALGSNLNDGMHPENVDRAQETAMRAAELASAPVEVALTQALSQRYVGEQGNEHFADLMQEVAADFPDDVNVLVMFADALMNLQPWDYWEADGVTPKGRASDIIGTLERAMEIDAYHPAALHLYIHAMEATAHPEQAEGAADRLAGSVPAAGHLVHMPAHIYNRIGRYADSIKVNRDAIAADEAFLARAGDAASDLYRFGYYPHNAHFLLVGAQSAGLAEDALAAADRLWSITSDEVSADLAWVQAIRTAPFTVHAQMRGIEEVLALPEVGEEFPLVQGFRHYARGTVFARDGRIEAAWVEAHAIKHLIETADLDGLEEQYLPARDLLGVAMHHLEGRIEQVQGNWDAAIHHLEVAAELEDGIAYMEPSYWYAPVRRTLGAVLLQAGRPHEARSAFKAALDAAPRDGWALWGLWQVELETGDHWSQEQAEDAFRAHWLGDPKLPSFDRL